MLDTIQSTTETLEGVKISPISFELVGKLALTFLIGVIIIRVLMAFVDRMLKETKKLSSVHAYVHSTIKAGLWFILILILADTIGIPVTSVLALLGVAGLAISLALQNTLSNLAGGLQVLIARPFVVGDYIDTDTDSGTVTEIGIAYSKLTTVDNKEILIPNYLMAASKIVNYTANGCRRVDLKFTASYHAPTEQVKASIFKAISAVPEVRTDPPPEVHLWDLGDHGVTYVSRVWADTPDYWKVHFALMEGVRERFLLDGIEIPYRHLDVTVVEKPLNDG